MLSGGLVLVVLLIAHVGMALWATRRVFLNLRIQGGRRIVVLLVVWLIPLIGPFIGRYSLTQLPPSSTDPMDSFSQSGALIGVLARLHCRSWQALRQMSDRQEEGSSNRAPPNRGIEPTALERHSLCKREEQRDCRSRAAAHPSC